MITLRRRKADPVVGEVSHSSPQAWTPQALDAALSTLSLTVDAWASDPDRTTRRETYRSA